MTGKMSALFLLALTLTGACGPSPNPTPLSLLTPTHPGDPPVTPNLNGVTVPSGQLLFQDDFSRPASGWEVFAEAQASATYTDGEYRLRLNQAPLRAWALLRGADLPNDVTIVVTGYPYFRSASGGYGVICRFTDAEHYYFFLLTPDGSYIIGKRSGGKQVGLSSPKVQPSAAILPGDVPNRLTVECAGHRLKLAINATPVAAVTDDEFSTGQVGLLAVATQSAGVEAHFDDLAIYAP